jgi:hypothetical protein
LQAFLYQEQFSQDAIGGLLKDGRHNNVQRHEITHVISRPEAFQKARLPLSRVNCCMETGVTQVEREFASHALHYERIPQLLVVNS